MDKNELQQWEYKCVQEEPARCMSACPIHVDARQFVKQVGLGKWDDALKTLSKTMPFPRILGRICDHPCESACKRGEAGDPIAIGALERLCVENAREKTKITILGRKETRVAIIGSGLSSLTAAWDLLRKGYQLSIFEPGQRLGGNLWDFTETVLPPDLISEELSILEDFGVRLELSRDVGGSGFISDLRRDFDALFVGLDTRGLDFSALELDENGMVRCDPMTRATSLDGIFAGGNRRNDGQPSPILDVLDGRAAATSIDRFTMNSSMVNGREFEGPYTSRLFTNIEGIPPVERVPPADPSGGYTREEAIREAGRCIQCECLECVKVCLYLDRNDGYPKKYARQVFNNEYVMPGRARTKNQFVNSCSNCGLCEAVCPNNFHVGDMMLQARRTMVRNKVMPPSFHEFSLLDMEYSNGERCALSRHEPGKDASAWLYFPSCQLCATSPHEVEASYSYLRENLRGGVGIMLRCCGAPAHWAGRDDLFREAQAAIRSEWERLGKPPVITACSTCRTLFGNQQPDMEIRTLWELVAEKGLPEGCLPHDAAPVSIVDPCMARHDRATQHQVRSLATSLGCSIEELPLSREKAECCGFGGLMFNANPAMARDVIRHRTVDTDPPDTRLYRQSVNDNDYLAYCAMCRDNLAAGGKRVSHLIEHLFPAGENKDPAGRGWISWSERRYNRALLRENILKLHGDRIMAAGEEYGMIKLFMTDETRRRVDDRRILESDIKNVIAYCEKTGKRLYHGPTGRYRGYVQSGNVTFWVEYAPTEEGFTVHNAYSHRMNIVGARS